jgi:hypothetical protein
MLSHLSARSALSRPLALASRGYVAGPLPRAPRIVVPPFVLAKHHQVTAEDISRVREVNDHKLAAVKARADLAAVEAAVARGEEPPTVADFDFTKPHPYQLLPPLIDLEARTRNVMQGVGATPLKLEQRKISHITYPASPVLVRWQHCNLIDMVNQTGEYEGVDTPFAFVHSQGPKYGKSTSLNLLSHALQGSGKLVLDYGAMYQLLRRGRFVEYEDGVGTVPDVSRALLHRFLGSNIGYEYDEKEDKKNFTDSDSILHSIKLPDSNGKSLFEDITTALASQSPTACCELLADLLDAVYTEGAIKVPVVVILDGVDSSAPLPEGYADRRGRRRTKDITWHGVYYYADYMNGERAIPVERLAWLKPLFEENGEMRKVPGKGSIVVMSNSKGDFPIPEEIRGFCHKRIADQVKSQGGKMVLMPKYDEGEFLSVMAGYMSKQIGVFEAWNHDEKSYADLRKSGVPLDDVDDEKLITEHFDIAEVRDMGIRSGLVPGEVMTTVLHL